MTEIVNQVPGMLIEAKAGDNAYGLVYSQERPGIGNELIDHLGLGDARKTSPAEVAAASLLLTLADVLARKQEESDRVDVTLRDLFEVKRNETSTDTFNRILNVVIARSKR